MPDLDWLQEQTKIISKNIGFLTIFSKNSKDNSGL